MIQDQTLLSVADNSGAKLVKCIKVLGGSKRRYARVGDIIVVAVRKVTPNGAIKKKHVTRAIVVRQRKLINRADGSSISFSDNAVVILNKDEKPVGTRIFGPIAREIREKSAFMKIVSLAPEVW